MANQKGKKLGLLYLKDYLEKQSDEYNPVTMKDIKDMLAEHDIISDRKTIYTDLKTLSEDYGLDLIKAGYRYYVASRDFELEEIKLLIDMVLSSNFITEKKTKKLIEKLENQVSVHEGKKLNRRIYVRKNKTNNENVYLNIDKISEAINSNRKILFQYFSYNIQKQKELRHEGKIHKISPYALIWVDQNYYMLGYDTEYREMRHYRVDRMTNISLSDEYRQGKKLFEKTDMSVYTNKVFYMFTGDETEVKFRCKNNVIDAIMDRFGDEIIIVPDADGYFTFSTEVVVSPQFFAWLSAFGTDVEVVHPRSVRKKIYNHFTSIADMYDDSELPTAKKSLPREKNTGSEE